MLFEEGQDPRSYFVRRILDQARQEGLNLTPLEVKYLSLTGQGKDDAASELLSSVKGKCFRELDQHVSGLIWRAYQQDLLNHSQAKEHYDRAIKALARVDEYPNLGMFVSCIALETPPKKLNAPQTPWVLIVLALLFVLLVVNAMWHRYVGP